MITYEDFVACAPPGGTNEERDEWFRAHDFDIDGLKRVCVEVAEYRLVTLENGDRISADDLRSAIAVATMFGFELAIRVVNNDRVASA
jgi:hypothetical protein